MKIPFKEWQKAVSYMQGKEVDKYIDTGMDDTPPCMVYTSGYYIMRIDDPKGIWHLILGNQEWISDNLLYLEKKLFMFTLNEMAYDDYLDEYLSIDDVGLYLTDRDFKVRLEGGHSIIRLYKDESRIQFIEAHGDNFIEAAKVAIAMETLND